MVKKKKSNIFVIGFPSGEEKDNGIETIFLKKYILAQNFPAMMKDIKPQNKEFLQTSSKTNTKRKKKRKRPHLNNHRKTAENQKQRGKS